MTMCCLRWWYVRNVMMIYKAGLAVLCLPNAYCAASESIVSLASSISVFGCGCGVSSRNPKGRKGVCVHTWLHMP